MEKGGSSCNHTFVQSEEAPAALSKSWEAAEFYGGFLDSRQSLAVG